MSAAYRARLDGAGAIERRLVELGKPFDVMVHPNRTHAISEGAGTSLHIQSLIARYFLDRLSPGPIATVSP